LGQGRKNGLRALPIAPCQGAVQLIQSHLSSHIALS
jgi:hypothetical protein